MFSLWTVTGLVATYLLILFALAFWGEKRFNDNQQHPWIYSLAMGVHCTSWAFFGTTTQASQYGWAFIPTYLGIILVMVFAFPVIRKIASLCHQHNISSLADFVALHYKKSHFVAALISLLCFFGVVPYIALQLNAMTKGVTVITEVKAGWAGDAGLYVTALMALFAILFGTRSIGLTDKRPGLMLTMAFESVVKLAALITVGLFVCYAMFDGVFDLLGQAQNHPRAREIIYADSAYGVYFSHVILGICAMFCLPRQFHVNFVENNGEEELRTSRWLFPLFLIMMTIFVLPTALAGHITFTDTSVATDTYALALPVFADNQIVTVVAFIGGVSAATSMVIVATLAVGIMISNNLVTPLWLQLQLRTGRQDTLTPGTLLLIRRITVVLVLGVAYLYYLDISQGAPLVKSGTISLALLSQIMPILMLGMFWPRRNAVAAMTGLLAGAGGWFYWLLWPSVKASYYFDPPPTDLTLGQGFIFSLLLNIGCFVFLSLILKSRDDKQTVSTQPGAPLLAVKIANLLALSERVLSGEFNQTLKAALQHNQGEGYANPELLSSIEGELASQFGVTSARILLSAIAEKEHVAIPELVELVEEASQTFQFNHELLQSSVEHIQHGICVLDRDLNLLAWNNRYLEMFAYPANTIKVGMPIRDVLSFNASRGLFGDDKNSEKEIQKRINYLQQGSRYKYLRQQPDGKVIELNGSPLPGGGFVTTYSDISEYIGIQQQLEEAKSNLEDRVEQRTQQLKEVNQALALAKQEAENANESKTRFLAAAGHDLMQPFNAATLFASMLEQQADNNEAKALSQNLVQSLNSADELLSMLLDMTKLESGVLVPSIQSFSIDEVIAPLATEFSIIASQKGLELRYVKSSAVVRSDKKLLRRIVQNLISNAIRYTDKGKVLIGARRHKHEIELAVYDTGPGIAKQDEEAIFQEFHQLEQGGTKQGLGLGLTIVDRISQLLSHQINLQSSLGNGTCFSVTVPVSDQQPLADKGISARTLADKPLILAGKNVLVVENEHHTREAVTQLLASWGAQVFAASGTEDVAQLSPSHYDLMLLDYHLDKGETGVQIARQVRESLGSDIPGVLNSANRGEEIREEAAEADLHFLPKPLKPAAFKRLLRQLNV